MMFSNILMMVGTWLYFTRPARIWQFPVQSTSRPSGQTAGSRQQAALDFVGALMACKVPRWALENPVSIISSHFRKPDQIIQPWQFGHEATKTTCLWLHGLPPLVPTSIVGKGARHVTMSGKSLPEWYHKASGPNRWKIRSKTFQGIANAMAQQWSTSLSPSKSPPTTANRGLSLTLAQQTKPAPNSLALSLSLSRTSSQLPRSSVWICRRVRIYPQLSLCPA